MSDFQRRMVWSAVGGLLVGMCLVLIGNSIYYRTATMDYGEGQVLMMLLDTYPETTIDARDYFIKCLSDGHITQYEYDSVLRKATRAVFYDRGDLSMGRHLVRNPC